jgi:hypothetical protein
MRLFTTCCLISFALTQQSSITKDAFNSVSAASRHSPTDWKIGVQLWTFHFVPFVQALEKADSAGIKYLEAFPYQRLGGDLPGTFGIEMSDATREKVKKLLASKGIHL